MTDPLKLQSSIKGALQQYAEKLAADPDMLDDIEQDIYDAIYNPPDEAVEIGMHWTRWDAVLFLIRRGRATLNAQ